MSIRPCFRRQEAPAVPHWSTDIFIYRQEGPAEHSWPTDKVIYIQTRGAGWPSLTNRQIYIQTRRGAGWSSLTNRLSYIQRLSIQKVGIFFVNFKTWERNGTCKFKSIWGLSKNLMLLNLKADPLIFVINISAFLLPIMVNQSWVQTPPTSLNYDDDSDNNNNADDDNNGNNNNDNDDNNN